VTQPSRLQLAPPLLHFFRREGGRRLEDRGDDGREELGRGDLSEGDNSEKRQQKGEMMWDAPVERPSLSSSAR
jgi:hypothetical protein